MRQAIAKIVLIVQFSSSRDGSALSALSLANGFRNRNWETHVVFAHSGPMMQSFARAGHQIYISPHKNWLRNGKVLRFFQNIWRERKASSAIEELIQQVNPGLIYVNSSVSLAGALAANSTNTPLIWHLRELFNDVGGELICPYYLRGLVKLGIKQLASKVIVNSMAVADNLTGGSEHVETVFNAVPLQFLEKGLSKPIARKKLGLPINGKIIGVPGNLRPVKGHPFLFNALADFLRESGDVTVVVTGSGSGRYKAALSIEVEKLGLVNHVSFIGTLQDMHAFYNACDLVCVPSISESFGRTVIEAFAAKVPVVATRVGGILEIVRDGETGLLVDYGDCIGLLHAIHLLLEDAFIASKLVQNARLEVESNFLESSYQERICSIADGVLGQP